MFLYKNTPGGEPPQRLSLIRFSHDMVFCCCSPLVKCQSLITLAMATLVKMVSHLATIPSTIFFIGSLSVLFFMLHCTGVKLPLNCMNNGVRTWELSYLLFWPASNTLFLHLNWLYYRKISLPVCCQLYKSYCAAQDPSWVWTGGAK